MEKELSLTLIEIIMSAGFSVLTLFIGYCIAEVRRVKKEVVAIVNKERQESITAARRLDTLDGTLSDITDYKLNSRNVVEKGTAAPRVHSKLLHLIHEGSEK